MNRFEIRDESLEACVNSHMELLAATYSSVHEEASFDLHSGLPMVMLSYPQGWVSYTLCRNGDIQVCSVYEEGGRRVFDEYCFSARGGVVNYPKRELSDI